MSNLNASPSSSFRQIFGIALFILVMTGIIYFVNRSNIFRRSDDLPHDVQYIVNGSAGVALISYTKPNGEASEPEFLSIPWRLPAIRYYEPTMVVLTAHNSMQYGEVECIILLDGKEWVQDKANAPKLNASCGGFVP